MAFQPSSNIYIGTVPFDSSYRHVRYFSNRTSQQNYFQSVCPTGLRRDDYTYQRIDNAVVVPFNAEELYGFNYCMFQNENYGDRWFYSFINDIEYVNPNSSRLHLELDFMQTWFLDCTVKSCMVEREHVNNDAIGAHIKDEGMATGEMIVTKTVYDQTSLYTVVACAVEPKTDGTYVNNQGDLYMNVSSGVSLSAFDMSTMLGQFKSFMKALSDNGQQDAISAIYMVPATVFPGFSSKGAGGYGAWVDASRPAREDILTFQIGFDTLNGYTPKNNKMYCYPYEYAELSNLVGDNQQLRLEFFSNFGNVTVMRTGGVDVNSNMLYIPTGYNGMDMFYEGAINMPSYPTCNWVYQSYANMLGQSKYKVEVPALFEDEGGNRYGELGTLEGDMNTLASAQNFLGNVGTLNFGGMAAGAYTTFAALSQKQRTPNTSRGGTNSSVTLANINAFKLAVRKYTCRAEMAKQIDDYFTVYGYLVTENKVPNITGRQNWNFVKTNGASVVGKVPAYVLKSINTIFDNGVTFWHTNDVGNYALPNSIV